MRVLSVLHPCIAVGDMAEALVFYRDLLGFEVEKQFVHAVDEVGPLAGLDDPDVPAAIVKCPDGTEIELLEFRRPLGSSVVTRRFEDVGVAVITLVVDEIDALVERLARNGYPSNGPIVPFTSPEGVFRAVHCPGPDGTLFTLGEWTPAAPQGD